MQATDSDFSFGAIQDDVLGMATLDMGNLRNSCESGTAGNSYSISRLLSLHGAIIRRTHSGSFSLTQWSRICVPFSVLIYKIDCIVFFKG